MMRTFLIAASMLLLSACNNSDSSDVNAVQDISTGVFVDAPVRGMTYRSSYRGHTNGSGEFLYLPGDTIVFELGGYRFQPVPAASVVTIVDLFDSGLIDRRVINLARLLQSLDLNDFTPDLLEIPDLDDLDFRGLNFDMAPDDFAADVLARTAVAVVRDDMITTEAAMAHLSRSFETLNLPLPELAAEGDTDGDGIDDLIDSDDDNNGIVDLNGGDELPALESPPERVTLPVSELEVDNNLASTGRIENTNDAFRGVTTDSDGDGIFDHLDFFPNDTAQSQYVDVAGSDTGDCSTPDQACRTIAYAASFSEPGDRIAVQGGEYFESAAVITTDYLTIRGVGANSTFIFNDDPASSDGILAIAPGLRVQVVGVTLSGGTGNVRGAAISAEAGELYLRELNIENTGSGEGNSSAVSMISGLLSVQQVNFSDINGRAIYASDSEIEVNASQFSRNQGTDIFTTRGIANLTRNTFTGNASSAIEVGALSGEVIIENSTFFENAIAITASGEGNTVANHITVRGNLPGALAVGGENLELNNSYIFRANCTDLLIDGAGNMIDSDTCGADAGFNLGAPTGAIGNELIATDQGTGILQLDAGSVAVDAVSCIPSVTVDQLGLPRPSGILCDVGAYELQL